MTEGAGVLRESLVDGGTVRWLEHGKGPPVVLLHGIPTSPRLWRHVLPLVDGHCLAWEMTGCGISMSDGEGLDLSLAEQADRLLRWPDDLGADLQEIEGGRHFTPEDHPDVIAAAVNQLLSTTR